MFISDASTLHYGASNGNRHFKSKQLFLACDWKMFIPFANGAKLPKVLLNINFENILSNLSGYFFEKHEGGSVKAEIWQAGSLGWLLNKSRK